MATGVKDTSVTFAARIVSLVLTIGTQSCLAWVLGPEGRGAYAISLLMATILGLVFMVGSDIAAQYFVASGKLSVSRVITHVTICIAISSALAILAGLFVLRFDLAFVRKATIHEFYLGLATIPAVLFARVLVQLLGSLREFVWLGILTIATSALQLALVLVFALGFRWAVEGALWAIVVKNCIMTVVILVFFRRKYDLSWVRPELRDVGRMLHYGIRYYFGKISNLVNVEIGTIILAFFASKSEIGLFAVASHLVTQAMIIPDTLTTVLIPRVARAARTTFLLAYAWATGARGPSFSPARTVAKSER